MSALIMEMVRELEETTLKKALEQHLQREPDIEDFKNCKMIFKAGEHDRYVFAYNDVTLGNIVRIFDYENARVTVSFEPTNEL